ncbi:FAD-dependent oxidoreductase [Luteolibacter soli]|uniref:FAD-dependent oxidoreductase n=1 Tax=Luteolibacter soli TaxID=3135280 RepID=A0ABU9AWE9_9BACT
MNRFFPVFAALVLPVFAEPASYDVVVYGGTSGGVIAAVQVAKSGRSVVLVSPTVHLGGLTTSGLGWTDLGKSSILGGLSREFYHRVYQRYQDAGAWNWQSRASFGNSGQGGPAFNDTTQVASVFEPKVAEAVFGSMIAEEHVPVITGRLKLDGGVVMSGGKINRLKLEDGREFAGKMFIDASYEGDLLPGAGVSFTVGREANAANGENYNGIQSDRATKNQLRAGIDPYVTPGNAASGLLPGVNADAGGSDGSADDRLQAYCFRMVLTDVAANRVMVAKPPGYNEADYELLFRSIDAGQTGGFFKLDLMPNRKTDSNNTGGISTDFIGKNYGPGWNWATLNHDQRQALAKEHENWQRGLIWALQNSPRVPASIRDAYAKWGLPADEFTDNGNWPWQLYVREARRMVSDYVMRQAHCSGALVAPDSIGLAAYNMDSHHAQRHVKNGQVVNEGDVQMPVGTPYPVSYRSIVPKAGECANLLVPWSLSATHMAFGSIRMEPVFMILSQSAAIAADLAIDGNLPVQQVPYSKLRPALLAASQALGEAAMPAPMSVVDNSDVALVAVTGAWTSGTSTTGFVGSDYVHDGNADQGSKQVAYSVPAGTTGMQRVFMRWTSHANRATNVPVEIVRAGGSTTITVNQRNDGGKWNLLGSFNGVEKVIVKNAGANGYVVADAVGFSPASESDDSDLRKLEPGQTEPTALVAALAAGQPRKVVVYGTSLTANGAWVSQMSQWLSAKYPNLLTMINSGMSGKNSAEGLAQLQTKVLAHHPDTVFIEFAMNDAFLYSDGTPQLSVDQARANLNAMIDAILAQNPKSEIILQTMNTVWNSPTGSNASATLRPNLAAYYEMYRSVAATRGLMLIDHQPAWAALQQGDLATFQSWVPDGVHPVAAGLSKVVLPLLKWKLTGGRM